MRLRFLSQNSIVPLLLILCLVLAALTYRGLIDPNVLPLDPPALGSADAGSFSTTATGGFSLPPLRSFAVVTERPLFSPDRRPVASGDTTADLSSFLLAGVIITPSSREALVMHGKPPHTEHVREGQAIDGWTVTSILPDRIILRDGIGDHELKLIVEKTPAHPATAQRRPPNG